MRDEWCIYLYLTKFVKDSSMLGIVEPIKKGINESILIHQYHKL